MIEYGYVLLKKTVQFLSEYKSSGKIYKELHISGRRPIITINKLDILIDNNFDDTGEAITTRDIDTILNTEKDINSVVGPSFCEQISRSSKYTYHIMSTYNSERTVKTACIQQNEQQFTIENHILSSI